MEGNTIIGVIADALVLSTR